MLIVYNGIFSQLEKQFGIETERAELHVQVRSGDPRILSPVLAVNHDRSILLQEEI